MTCSFSRSKLRIPSVTDVTLDLAIESRPRSDQTLIPGRAIAPLDLLIVGWKVNGSVSELREQFNLFPPFGGCAFTTLSATITSDEINQ